MVERRQRLFVDVLLLLLLLRYLMGWVHEVVAGSIRYGCLLVSVNLDTFCGLHPVLFISGKLLHDFLLLFNFVVEEGCQVVSDHDYAVEQVVWELVDLLLVDVEELLDSGLVCWQLLLSSAQKALYGHVFGLGLRRLLLQQRHSWDWLGEALTKGLRRLIVQIWNLRSFMLQELEQLVRGKVCYFLFSKRGWWVELCLMVFDFFVCAHSLRLLLQCLV